MFLIVLRDLQYRRWRVLATVVLMGIVFTLLFVMAGLTGQFRTEPHLATDRVAGERNWLVPEGSRGPFTSPLPVPLTDFPPVPDAVPVLIGAATLDGERVFTVARTLDAEQGPPLVEGRYPAGADEVVVDRTALVALGDEVVLSGQTVEIVGLTDDATILAGVPLVFTAPADEGPDAAVAVLTVSNQPATGFRLMSPDEVGTDTGDPLENAISTISLVETLLWVITAIIVAAVTYITALERTRDVAVLKAVGGRTSTLAASLLVQGLIMTLLAVALATVLQQLVAPIFPLTVRIPGSAFWQIPVTAAVAALVAGLGGVLRIRSTSPVEAFA